MRCRLVALGLLASISACKDKAPPPPPPQPVKFVEAPAPVVLPSLPDDPKATVDPAGIYSGAGGKLQLGADKRVELIRNGKVIKGKWAWYADRKRILVTADKSIWAVADGALYRMDNRDAPLENFRAEQLWKKAQ